MPKGHPNSGPLYPCDHCGTPFRIRPYKIGRYANHFCSMDCKNKSMERTSTLECMFCGAPVTRRVSAFFRGGAKRIFCDHTCSARWRSANPTSIRFGKALQPHQRQIYGTSCILCGFDRVVEYAHIIPARRGGTIHPDNIVPLCPNHHTLMDRDLLTSEESESLDDFIIRAWSSPNAARFPDTPAELSSEPEPSQTENREPKP